jgi:hypothetical protein
MFHVNEDKKKALSFPLLFPAQDLIFAQLCVKI